jgi:hypothetical protein
MSKKRILFLILASFSFSCVENNKIMQHNQNLQNATVSKEQKAKPTKFLFDAVDLLGKKPSQIDKIFGKPDIQQGKSKSDPTVKSHWRWYKYEKELAVFIDEDTRNGVASSITLIFKTDPTDVKEAAKMVGINLEGQKPVKSQDFGVGKEERYELNVKGKSIVVYFFKAAKSEDTIKVFYNE